MVVVRRLARAGGGRGDRHVLVVSVEANGGF